MLSLEQYLGLTGLEVVRMLGLDLAIRADRDAFRATLERLIETPASQGSTESLASIDFAGQGSPTSGSRLLAAIARRGAGVDVGSVLADYAAQSTRCDALLPEVNRALLLEDESLEVYRTLGSIYGVIVGPEVDRGVHLEGKDQQDLAPLSDEAFGERVLDTCADVINRLRDHDSPAGVPEKEVRELLPELLAEARNHRPGPGHDQLIGRLRVLLTAGRVHAVAHQVREYFQLQMEEEKRGKGWVDVFRAPEEAIDSGQEIGKQFKWTDWKMLSLLRKYFSGDYGDHMHDLVLDEVGRFLARNPGRTARVLIVGVGEGRLADDVSALGADRVAIVSTDYVPGNVVYAYAHYVRDGVRRIVSNQPANVANLRGFVDGEFDLVISSGAIRYFVTEYGAQAAREIMRVTAPEGVILFQDALRPAWAYLTSDFQRDLTDAGLVADVRQEVHPVKNISITYKLLLHYERARPGDYELLLRDAVDRLVTEGYGADYRDVLGRLTGIRREVVRLVRAARSGVALGG